MRRAEGKDAAVPGAGSGIRPATANALAREGCRTATSGRRAEPLRELGDGLELAGVR